MLNYKPNISIKEFEPCTRPDPEVQIAMSDPGYILRHKNAVANY